MGPLAVAIAVIALIFSALTFRKVGGLHALLESQSSPSSMLGILKELTRDVRHLTERMGQQDKKIDDHEQRIQLGVKTSNQNHSDILAAVEAEGAKTRNGMRDIVKPLVTRVSSLEKRVLEIETDMPGRP